ncbi:Swi5-domain-containing protein [Apiosordaria backusii]|uniref:Swi5-domain-containing protein n=1 Tax=Apiosordaria backusii TaxID=314023 RepID=A0AA40ECU4_9PEZI|nr:Swi5-domain-containing protein [Apiosordaria backusii]
MQQDSDDPHDTNLDLFKPYVQTELTNADLFDEWLQQQLDGGKDHQRVISKLKVSLIHFKQILMSLSLDDIDVDAGSWHMHAQAQVGVGKDDLTVIVTIPGPEKENIVINAKDKAELDFLMSDKYLGYMTTVWCGFAQSLDQLVSYARRCRELKSEEAELSHPAETTVQAHIDLLKEYNDMKDIGQQLIGLIAENQGVPIGRLYENGDYGVTADD